MFIASATLEFSSLRDRSSTIARDCLFVCLFVCLKGVYLQTPPGKYHHMTSMCNRCLYTKTHGDTGCTVFLKFHLTFIEESQESPTSFPSGKMYNRSNVKGKWVP